MDAWIEELWRAVETAEWGTDDLIDAVWDLCCVADCGLVSGGELDRRLQDRCNAELVILGGKIKLYNHRPPNRDWDHCYKPPILPALPSSEG